jgi:hypothetical protein
MPELMVIQGGRDSSLEDDTAGFQRVQADEGQFGPPPNLLIGLLTSLVGAGAGIISLVIYFKIFLPGSYASPIWLQFVLAGAIAGFFLRIERPFLNEINSNST